jgi:hypothetical protein
MSSTDTGSPLTMSPTMLVRNSSSHGIIMGLRSCCASGCPQRGGRDDVEPEPRYGECGFTEDEHIADAQ